MARITVEDCLKHLESRFELVILAAGRAKMLLRSAKPVAESDNREVVTALREIAEHKVYFVEPEEAVTLDDRAAPVEAEETGESEPKEGVK